MGMPNEDKQEVILKGFLFWLGGSIVAVFLMSLATRRENFLAEYLDLYYSINVTATIMISGVPLVLSSLFLLTPKWRRMQIVRWLERGHSIHHAYLRISLEVISLNTLFIASISFLMLLVTGTSLSYLLILALTGFVFSLILSPLAVFLTLSLNNAIASICCIFAIFWTLSFLYGSTPFQLFQGEVSLFHPYHLYRFMSLFMAGIEFPTTSSMVYYLQIFVTPDALVLPLLLWTIIGLVMFVAGVFIFPRALKAWDIESDTIWRTVEDKNGGIVLIDYTKVKQSLVKQQRYVIGVLFVLVLFVASINYIQTAPMFVGNNENEEILYQSPIGGEEIVFGLWLYGEVDFSQATVEGELWKEIEVRILNWGSAPQDITVSMNSNIVALTLPELLELNETDRAGLFGSTNSGIDRNDPETGSGFTSVDEVGVHVWGIRFFNEEHDNEEFTFTVMITISVRGE